MGGRRPASLLVAISALAACTSLPVDLPLRATADPIRIEPGGGEDELGVSETRRAVLRPAAASLIDRLNEERAAHGLPRLEVSDGLIDLAFTRCEDMAARGYLASHDPRTGEPLPLELMVNSGFGGRLAEVLAASAPGLQDLAAAVMAQWLASPVHRSVLLDPAYRYAGSGLMVDDGDWKVVLLLAERAPQER